jgi:aspartate racemase
MKTIGVLGGMSWVSTQLYYRLINEAVAQRLGSSHSAKLLVHSFDFAEIEAFQEQGDWHSAGRVLGEAAYALREAGAEFIVIAANTMHLVAPDVERISGLPVIHIGDATAEVLEAAGITRAALLGTKYTMEQPFIRERIEARGIDVLLPNDGERAVIHQVVYDELIKNVVSDRSRETYIAIVNRLADEGAQAVILGCTEIGLLLRPGDTAIPLFDTASIHAAAAAEKALAP